MSKFHSILFLICTLLYHTTVNAQITNNTKEQESAPKVLISGDGGSISGFGGIIVEFSSIDGDAAIMNGAGGAALFNHSFILGGYGASLTNKIYPDAVVPRRETTFAQGGVLVGYAFESYRLVHFGVSSRLGWGVIRISPENSLASSVAPVSDNVLAFTPQAEVEVNLSYWFRINAGMGYRIVSGIDNSFYEKNAFNSPALTLGFMFGWFK
jgi:hypothetical protein